MGGNRLKPHVPLPPFIPASSQPEAGGQLGGGIGCTEATPASLGASPLGLKKGQRRGFKPGSRRRGGREDRELC